MSTGKFVGFPLEMVYPVLNSRAATSTELPANDHRDSEKTNLPNQFIDPRVYLKSLSRPEVNKTNHSELKEIKSIFEDIARLVKSDSPFSHEVISNLNPLLQRFNEIMLGKLEDQNLSKIVFNIMNYKKKFDLSHSDNIPDKLISIYDTPLVKYKTDGRNLNFFDAYEQEFLKHNLDLVKKTINFANPSLRDSLNERDYERITESLLNVGNREDLKNNYLKLIVDLVNEKSPNLNINFNSETRSFISSTSHLTSEDKYHLRTLNEKFLGTNSSPYNLLDKLMDLNQGLSSSLPKPELFRIFQNNFKNFLEISEIIFAQV